MPAPTMQAWRLIGAPTLGRCATSLPPEGAFASLGRPGACSCKEPVQVPGDLIAVTLAVDPAQAMVFAFGHVIVAADQIVIEPAGLDALAAAEQRERRAVQRTAFAFVQTQRLRQEPQRPHWIW